MWLYTDRKGGSDMIYLDHAATSYPKPMGVYRAMSQALHRFGANPGRGGYPMSMDTAEMIARCRMAAATFFGVHDERRVIFTSGCTHALNIVINSFTSGGGRIAVSDMEHNAVMRPLHAVSPRYPVYDVAAVIPGDTEATLAAFRRVITPRTRAIVCTHASNVTGEVMPIAALGALAHEHSIPLVVDAAQSAGHLSIDMTRDDIDYLCVAGHKGLCGPMGTGMLICRGDTKLSPLMTGGTGSRSASFEQPHDFPDRLESGTPNVAGIAGLFAGIERVRRIGISRIAKHEQALVTALYDAFSKLHGVTLYTSRPGAGTHTGVLSVNVDGISPDDVAQALAVNGVAVRAGLHCAPAAHRKIGTFPLGTVRFSVGETTTRDQVEKSVEIFKKIIKNPLQFVGGI